MLHPILEMAHRQFECSPSLFFRAGTCSRRHKHSGGYCSRSRVRRLEYIRNYCPGIRIVLPPDIAPDTRRASRGVLLRIHRMSGHCFLYNSRCDKKRGDCRVDQFADVARSPKMELGLVFAYRSVGGCGFRERVPCGWDCNQRDLVEIEL